MRLTEILLSVPELLLILFLQAIWGTPTVLSISVIIGITSWFSIAKVVRTEVRQIRNSEYVIASRCMGGSFLHILRKHLAPNFLSAIMFMVVMNVRGAIVSESTLSFMGMGLPLEVISWIRCWMFIHMYGLTNTRQVICRSRITAEQDEAFCGLRWWPWMILLRICRRLTD